MRLNKIHNFEDLENSLVDDREKMTFALRQVAELMRVMGIAGVTQAVNGYEFTVRLADYTFNKSIGRAEK